MQNKLLQIYDHFDTWARDFDFACKEGCATCCTRSVTMTTLEPGAVYFSKRESLHHLPGPLIHVPQFRLKNPLRQERRSRG